MEKELNKSLERFPFEYPIRVAFKIYSSRLFIFMTIVFMNLMLLGLVILLKKQNFLFTILYSTFFIYLTEKAYDYIEEKSSFFGIIFNSLRMLFHK